MKRVPVVLATIAFALAVYASPATRPATPASVKKLILAQKFNLTKSYKFEWREEQPDVTSGWILVLKVDPEYVRPQQTAEPVLYVGDQTAERVNVGFKSGCLVVIVPGDVDLAESRIWFGDPDLPEKIDAEKIEKAKRAAIDAKIQPFDRDQVKAATDKAVEKFAGTQRDKNNAITYADRNTLMRALAPLIGSYAPDEVGLRERLEMIPATPEDT